MMASSLEESDRKLSSQDEFIWECQTNDDPWNAKQTAKWTPYSDIISSTIEEAYKHGSKEICVDDNYLIHLRH